MIKGIKSVNLDVSNMSAAMSFFIGQMDLPVLREIGSREFLNRWEMGYGRPSTMFAVEQQRNPVHPPKPGRVTIMFETDDIQADYRALLEKGVKFTSAPVDDPFDGKVAYFEGPDAVTLALVEPFRDQ